MTREVSAEPLAVPASLAPLVAGYRWSRDLVGEAGAAVHRLHAPGRSELFLKHGTGDVADDIVDEMVRMRWLAGRWPVPAIEAFVLHSNGAWLLMSALPGRTAYQMLTDETDSRDAVVDALAAHLRRLHALPLATCPFDSGHEVRMEQARARIAAGVVEADDFDDEHDGWTAEQVWDEMVALLPLSDDPVVTHGDYSLDNILIDGERVSGCIDVGRAGVADRYQDLAILWNCLGEFGSDLQQRFIAAYGLNEADERKLRFHLCLDELF